WDVEIEDTFPMACNFDVGSCSKLQENHEANFVDWKQISDKRTKNQAKMDKTEHGMEKRGKPKSNRNQSQPQQSQIQEVIKSKKIQL
ncbi:hypothetical protein Tco_1571850, partial [Tanacetum coccineum]